MNNNQLYPFQRNRYYSGKLLTSADFQAEQDYYNNKERFMNSLMYGSGIICGLGVISLDDLSILVESGVAIDGLGREIILESSAVKRLSAIEGFDEITSDEVSLCIRYEEKPVNSVYSVNKGQADNDFEYSRISETCQLFLIDKEVADASYDMETEFLNKGVLYEDSDFEVALSIPTTVSKKRVVKMIATITKRSAASSKISLHGILQIPGFLTPDNTHEIELNFENVALEEGEVYEKEYWVTVTDSDQEDTLIILESGTGHAYVNDEAVNMPSGFELKVMLSSAHPRELVNREIGRMSLEMRDIGGYDEYIRLADITLVSTAGAYIIQDVEENSVKKYIGAPAQNLLRSSYLDYFVKEGSIKNPMVRAKASKENTPGTGLIDHAKLPEVATGVLEIPLGDVARKGDIKYSGEIVHGLGKGNVYVQIGFETIVENATFDGRSSKMTIYGNADLFRKEKAEAPMVETAVKVLNDKGSFVVAAKLLENVDYLVLTYRWVAMRFPAGNDLGIAEDYSGKSIIPETPTVVLETKESHFFGVRFENMETCTLMYELTEEDSGEITSDGIYTAPAKEGVYEIRIYCMDMPVICAYAYAIVKKKGLETEEKQVKEKGNILDEIPI